MPKEFRVVDCRTEPVDLNGVTVVANTAEMAARLVLGEELVRGGNKRGFLRAKVYLQAEALTLIKLYGKSET